MRENKKLAMRFELTTLGIEVELATLETTVHGHTCQRIGAVFRCKTAFLKSKFKDDPVRVQRHTVLHLKDLE